MSEQTISKAVMPSTNRIIPATKKLPNCKFPKGGIGPQFVNRYMHLFEQYWYENKKYPDDVWIIETFGFSKLQVEALNASKFWLQSLDRRGIKRPTHEPNTLTPEQWSAIAVITNYSDRRPVAARLEAMGISEEQLQGWQQDPEFQRQLTLRADDTFANVAPVARIRLAQKVEKGDLNAIKFYFEVTGQAETPETINIKRAMNAIIEAMQKHCTPEQLQAVQQEVNSVLGMTKVG